MRRVTVPWAVAAVVVFVVVDAALIWWAVTSIRAETGAQQGEVLPTIPPASPAPTSTSEPDAVSPAATPTPVIRPAVVLAALDANVAYRGSTGTCPGVAASIEVTLDGGATWDSGATEGLTDLQSVEPSEGDIVTMIARDAACSVGRYRSFVLGDDWEATSEPERTWYVDVAQAVAPSGISLPCDGAIAQLVSASATSAAVLCESGEVLVTSDAGVVWAATSAPESGVVAVAAGPAGYLVAVTSDGCRGIRIVVDTPADAQPQPGACLEADPAPGTTAIDVAPDGTLWAWTGGVLARSADGGATW